MNPAPPVMNAFMGGGIVDVVYFSFDSLVFGEFNIG
jgi:hypothetical protein